jgi:CheY-like chemotaxis protein
LPILLAEDEETDVLMFGVALERTGLSCPLVSVRDGREALDYLSGGPPYQDRTRHPLPALIVLDLKMPRLTGFDVLAWLRTRPDLQRIPAVVLSSSSYPEDIHKALALGARDYHIKPHSLEDLVALLRKIAVRWLRPQD